MNQRRRPPGFRSQLKRVRLEVLEQDAAVPVDDGLRTAGRARREEHEERVVEGDRQKLERPGLGEQLVPRGARPATRASPYGTCTTWRSVGRAARIVADLLAAVDRAVAKAVAGDGQQHGRARAARAGRSTLRAPSSGAQLAQTAPRLAVAANATSVSGMFGR